MKLSATAWPIVRVLFFVTAMVALLLAPPAFSAYTWLLLAVPLYFWIRGSFDASLSPGDRSINRVLTVMSVVVTVAWCLRLLR